MDINNYRKVSGLILVIIVVLLIIYISIKKDDFGSMEKLLQGNTDIELIRNTDEPTKKTSIIVNSDDFFSKTMTKGELGVAESYMDGDWDTPDLERTLSNIISNQDKLEEIIDTNLKRVSKIPELKLKIKLLKNNFPNILKIIKNFN